MSTRCGWGLVVIGTCLLAGGCDKVTVGGAFDGGPDVAAQQDAAVQVVPEVCQDTAEALPRLGVGLVNWAGSVVQVNTMWTTEDRRCRLTVLDDHCSYVDCLTTDWTGDAGVIHGPSFGQVTVSAAGGIELTLEPDAYGIYLAQTSSVPFQEGTDFTVVAAGADIPAFTRQIQYPSEVDVTAPVRPDGGVLEIDRANAFTVTWTPTDEKVCVILGESGPTSKTFDMQELYCVYDGSAGSAVISAEALQLLKANAVWAKNFLDVTHLRRECLNVGGHHLELGAYDGSSRFTAISFK